MDKRKLNENDKESPLGVTYYILVVISILISILFFPIAILASIKVVPEYMRVVILRLGRLKGKKVHGPGVFYALPIVDSVYYVDLRVHTIDLPSQQVLTKDSVSVTIDAVIFCQVNDPIKSVVNVVDYKKSASMLGQTSLRTIMSNYKLNEILSCQKEIANRINHEVNQTIIDWGIEVREVSLKDIRLPDELKRIMAVEAEAQRDGNAKVISANSELEASSALAKAAGIMSEAPSAMTLRLLHTLQEISAEKTNTIIMPIPIELLSFCKNYSKETNNQSSNSPLKTVL